MGLFGSKPKAPDSGCDHGVARAAGIAGLLLFYCLSPLPVYSLLVWMGVNPFGKVRTVFGVVYWPLEWLAQHVPWVNAFFDWYGTLLGF